jgi:transaldolase
MTTEHQIRPSRLAGLAAVGSSVWLDSLSRAMIESGELERLVREREVVGVTANPAIFEKAISGGSEYDAPLAALAREGLDAVAAYEALAARTSCAPCTSATGSTGTRASRSRRTSLTTPTRR